MRLGQEQRFEGPDRPPGNDGEKALVLADDPRARVLFHVEIVAEQTASMVLAVFEQRGRLLGRLVGDVLRRPDLPVRMRVAGAHHRAPVLEDLDVVDLVHPAEVAVLGGPGVDDAADVGDLHAGEGETVVGMETQHTAEAPFALRLEQGGPALGLGRRGVGQQRRVVVVEDVDVVVDRGLRAAGPFVAGAEVAGRVVVNIGEAGGGIDLALPGALGAVRRDQDPLFAKGIVAAVGVLEGRFGHGVSFGRRLGWSKS